MATAASFPLSHAIALGVLQGPTELLPVSSSGHTALVPALLGWPYAALPPEHRKAYEVALHAGGAAGIAATELLRRPLPMAGVVAAFAEARASDAIAALGAVSATTLPAVIGGLVLGRRIEERLGAPRGVAAAQIVAGAALGAADRLPARRPADAAGGFDALVLGLAQAAALAPGVSRAGGMLTAARLLGFRRPDAAVLAWRAALPVLVGATALKGARLARDGLPRELRRPFAAGTAAAFGSTLASAPLARVTMSARSFVPMAAYRIALGVGALLALRGREARQGARRRGAGPCG